MRHALLLAGVLVCLTVSPALAQDPVQVDAKHYKVEVDNDQVRVLRTHIGPKESSPMHEHPPGVVTFLTDAHVKFILADGKAEERTAKAGSVRYRPAVKHAVENLSETDVEVVEVELKATSAALGQNKKSVVVAKDAPQAIGPYSQAVKAGGFVFASGQIALDPATGKLIEGDVKAQAERVLKNLSAVLAAAGSSLDRTVRTTVFLKNISDFTAMNEVYGQFFKGEPPARSTIGVAALPRDALVEIDVVALQ